MKRALLATLVMGLLTTGFTCSKKEEAAAPAPEMAAPQEAPAPEMPNDEVHGGGDQMGAPTEEAPAGN